MIDLAVIDYSAFDKPEICRLLFYPRRESYQRKGGGADHNDIFFRGMKRYLEAIGKFIEIVTVQRS